MKLKITITRASTETKKLNACILTGSLTKELRKNFYCFKETFEQLLSHPILRHPRQSMCAFVPLYNKQGHKCRH